MERGSRYLRFSPVPRGRMASGLGILSCTFYVCDVRNELSPECGLGEFRSYLCKKAASISRKCPGAKQQPLNTCDLESPFQPRTRTALKLRMTWPPEVGRPKLRIGLKRENSSI